MTTVSGLHELTVMLSCNVAVFTFDCCAEMRHDSLARTHNFVCVALDVVCRLSKGGSGKCCHRHCFGQAGLINGAYVQDELMKCGMPMRNDST